MRRAADPGARSVTACNVLAILAIRQNVLLISSRYLAKKRLTEMMIGVVDRDYACIQVPARALRFCAVMER